MIQIRVQQREISKDLPPGVQERVQKFRTEGVSSIRKVATLTDHTGAMLVAVVYGVHPVPLLMSDIQHHVKWLYVYEHGSWLFTPSTAKTIRRALRIQLMRGIHLEETVREMNNCVASAACPFIRFSIVDDHSITPRAVAWPREEKQLRELHARAANLVKRSPPPIAAPTPAPMAGLFHVVPMSTGVHASVPEPVVPVAANQAVVTKEEQMAHLTRLSDPYQEAVVKRGMACLCFAVTIQRIHQPEYAKRPVMFSAYVSLAAADGFLRPIPSLYIPCAQGSMAWCVVPLNRTVPATAKLHIDAYQEMNNAAGTRVSHCKIAHVHFGMGALLTPNAFQEDFMHCVDHDRRMFTVQLQRDKEAEAGLYGNAASRITVNRNPATSPALPVSAAGLRKATRAYIDHLHAEIKRHGGMAAKFPSGKIARDVVEKSDTTEGEIPLVSYINMSVSARIVSEQNTSYRTACAFVNNLCHLACVVMMVPVHVARERLAEFPKQHTEFCLHLLAECVRVIPTCLAYSVDKEGENNTLPWAVPDFVRQQVDCEELAILCSMIFHHLRRVGRSCPGGSLARLMADRVCENYDPMLCLVTTSAGGEASSSTKAKVAEEADATHLVCVLWPQSGTHSSPILLETMANVSPLPHASSVRNTKDHGYLPLSLNPFYTQEKFFFDHVYRDIIRSFLFNRETERYVEQLAVRSNAQGVGAPFADILSVTGRARLVPVHMDEKTARATDLSSELTYPLGLQLDSSALSMSEERADECTRLFIDRKCAHVFLLSTDRRSMASLTGKTEEKIEDAIKHYLHEEIKKAERVATKQGSESDSYTIEGVLPTSHFYLLPGLYTHVVGLKFPATASPRLYLRAPSHPRAA